MHPIILKNSKVQSIFSETNLWLQISSDESDSQGETITCENWMPKLEDVTAKILVKDWWNICKHSYVVFWHSILFFSIHSNLLKNCSYVPVFTNCSVFVSHTKIKLSTCQHLFSWCESATHIAAYVVWWKLVETWAHSQHLTLRDFDVYKLNTGIDTQIASHILTKTFHEVCQVCVWCDMCVLRVCVCGIGIVLIVFDNDLTHPAVKSIARNRIFRLRTWKLVCFSKVS